MQLLSLSVDVFAGSAGIRGRFRFPPFELVSQSVFLCPLFPQDRKGAKQSTSTYLLKMHFKFSQDLKTVCIFHPPPPPLLFVLFVLSHFLQTPPSLQHVVSEFARLLSVVARVGCVHLTKSPKLH